MALIRTISTARLVHLTAALFLVLTIMSRTSPSCQAGNGTYCTRRLFLFFLHKKDNINYLSDHTYCFILYWVGLRAQVWAAIARRRLQHGGECNWIVSCFEINFSVHALVFAMVCAYMPLGGTTSLGPTASMMLIHISAAAHIIYNGVIYASVRLYDGN